MAALGNVAYFTWTAPESDLHPTQPLTASNAKVGLASTREKRKEKKERTKRKKRKEGRSDEGRKEGRKEDNGEACVTFCARAPLKANFFLLLKHVNYEPDRKKFLAMVKKAINHVRGTSAAAEAAHDKEDL